MLKNVSVDWAVIFLLAPVALELLRQTLGWRIRRSARLFFLAPRRHVAVVASRSSC